MVTLRPLLSRLLVRLVGRTSLESCAKEVIELAPAVTTETKPAITFAQEFEKANCYFLGREAEHRRIAGGARLDGPTTAYRIRDGLLGGGTLYVGNTYEVYQARHRRLVLSGQAASIPSAILTTSAIIEHYFGDWALHGLSLELLAEQLGRPGIAFARPDWLHEPGYRELTGLHSRRERIAHVSDLWVIDDRGLNQGRSARFGELRSRIAKSCGSTSGSSHIYLSRGSMARGRVLLNGDQIENVLAARGFQIIEPEHETPHSLIRAVANAKVAVTVEGSANTHLLLAMKTGSSLINIQPPQRFTAPAKDMADMVGMHYGFVVGDQEGVGLTVEPDRLLRLIDLVEASV